MLVAAEDRMDVGDAGAASTAVVGVVGYREESYARFEVSVLGNFLVKVVDYGN